MYTLTSFSVTFPAHLPYGKAEESLVSFCCLFWCGYLSRVAPFWGQGLFLWKYQWLQTKVHMGDTARPRATELLLLGKHCIYFSATNHNMNIWWSIWYWLVVRDMYSLLVLLSVMEIHKQLSVITVAWWPLSAITCTSVCVPCTLAMATLWGW